jgi:hypothetical protein
MLILKKNLALFMYDSKTKPKLFYYIQLLVIVCFVCFLTNNSAITNASPCGIGH